jgi:hypothetical protein
MNINISENGFNVLMNDDQFKLPLEWDGVDFQNTLTTLFDNYKKALKEAQCKKSCKDDQCLSIDYSTIEDICSTIIDIVKKQNYVTVSHNVDSLMKTLEQYLLREYQKTGSNFPIETDNLHLFRCRNIDKNKPLSRKNIFHVPFDKINCICSTRYSLEKVPALYLATNIKLAAKETGLKKNDKEKKNIVSDFRINRENCILYIKVLELAIRPQDFSPKPHDNSTSLNKYDRKIFDELNLTEHWLRQNYLYWYPLIAACSFIRHQNSQKEDGIYPEYIIPQLLMNWINKKARKDKHNNITNLYGIRYFSCKSKEASDMGYNYVFPVVEPHNNKEYCEVLTEAFSLTKPCEFDIENIAKVEDDFIMDRRKAKESNVYPYKKITDENS